MSLYKPYHIAVLISGFGSNLQAIIDAITADKLHANLCVVVSDQMDAQGLIRAKQAGIKTHVITAQDYSQHDDYDRALIQYLKNYPLDLIILSGFMRILGPHVIQQFTGKIINIHPSLLPKYRGLNTYERVLNAGEKEHGTTVHFVTSDLDGGPIIAQRRLDILPDDTPETLKQRTQIIEHQLYPEVIQAFCEGRVHLTNGGVTIAQV